MDTDEVLRIQNTVLILEGVTQGFLISEWPHFRERHKASVCSKESSVQTLSKDCIRLKGRTDLASGVHNLGAELLVLELDVLAKRVLNGRVVAFDKVAIDELDCERGFAYRSGTRSVDCWIISGGLRLGERKRTD